VHARLLSHVRQHHEVIVVALTLALALDRVQALVDEEVARKHVSKQLMDLVRLQIVWLVSDWRNRLSNRMAMRAKSTLHLGKMA
jgi:hypothetical protein